MQHPDIIANDVSHALKRLARLEIDGAIDDDESVTKKAELLARVWHHLR